MADGSIIIDTLLDTKDFKNQMNKLKGITDSGMKPVLVSIGAIATAITGVSASAVKFGTEYQKASNQLQASTGATAEEMNNLKEVMKNVYANNFGESMEDVANAVSLVRKEMGYFESQDELQKVTQDAIALRDTFGYDVTESVRSAQALISNFGISAEEAFDLITSGSQRGLDYSGELLDNISEYSVQFGKLGLSAEDMFTIFDNGVQAGAFNLDKIGDAVKEFSIRAIDGSNTTIDGFTRLGLNADEMAKKFASGGDVAKNAFFEVIQRISEMDNAVEQSKVGVDLFGTMWEDLGPTVITQLGTIRDGYNDVAGSAEKLSQVKYDDLGSAMQGIGRQIQTNLLLPISNKLLPIFSDLANKLSEAFASGKLQSSIDKISDAIGGLVEGIAGIVEKWLPTIIDLVSWIISNAPTIISLLGGIAVGMKVFQIGSSIAKFVSGFKSAMTAVQGVSGAFKAFNAVLNANPIILIVSIIATLVTALITLWNTNDGFRNAVISAWNAIKEAFETVVNAIVGFFTETIPNAWNNFITGIQNLGQTIWNTLVNAWNSIVAFFTETIPQWIQNIITWFQQLPYNIGLLIGQILGHIANFGLSIWNWTTTELPKIIGNIINWFAQLPGKIWEWLTQAINNIIQWGVQTWQQSNQAMMNFFNGVINWFKQLPGNIWNWLVQAVNNVVNWIANMKAKADEGIKNMIDSIINWFKQLPQNIANIGKNIVEGLWNGITGAAGWLWNKISGFASGIINGFKSAFGIHSPSKVFNEEIGKFLALGLGEGFDENINSVFKDMKSTVDFETQKLSANLSTTATNNRMFTANITTQPSNVYLDSKKVGRIVTLSVTKTLRGAGAY